VDDNKRMAFLAMGLFLTINGKRVRADQVYAIHTILNLAAGTLDEAALAAWVREHIRPSGQ
jgi:death-on-curing protein